MDNNISYIRNIPLEHIVAYDNTKAAMALTKEFGIPKPRNHKELTQQLKKIIASGESGLAEVANLHPDKDLILAIFAQNNQEYESGYDGDGCGCGCNGKCKCKGTSNFTEDGDMIDKLLARFKSEQQPVQQQPAQSTINSNYQLLFGFAIIATLGVLLLKK